LVDQRCRCERVAGSFAGKVPHRDAVNILVDLRKHLRQAGAFRILDAVKQPRERFRGRFVHVRRPPDSQYYAARSRFPPVPAPDAARTEESISDRPLLAKKEVYAPLSSRPQRAVQVERRADECEMREGLREIAQGLAAAAGLFRVQTEVI